MSAVCESPSVRDHRIRERDDEYPRFERVVRARVASLAGPLFTTDAENLYDVFLDALLTDARQHYACRSCRKFVETYGSLARVSARERLTGHSTAAIWFDLDVPDFFRRAVDKISNVVNESRITGVFYSSETSWGVRQSPKGWTHLSGENPSVFKDPVRSASQKSAERTEDRKTLLQGLADYPLDLVRQAVRVLESDALDRSEKTLGVAKWLLDLQQRLGLERDKRRRENLVWLAVATAPPGFCHVRSTMISTLLDDLKAGTAFDEVKDRWARKMHPLRYQRPTAPPRSGAIDAAEKLVERLGVASALRRRFARLDEVLACAGASVIWVPSLIEDEGRPGGVFDHLRRSKKSVEPVTIPRQTMTWDKFRRTILPTARSIRCETPASGSYFGMVTAADPEAKPILQWDDESRRNPFSKYFWHGGSSRGSWNLPPVADVVAIVPNPAHFHDEEKFKHHERCAMLILAGATETRDATGWLFPETLKAEFHGIRSVIEANARTSRIEGAREGTANGIAISNGDRWSGVELIVTTDGGDAKYRIDRWD